MSLALIRLDIGYQHTNEAEDTAAGKPTFSDPQSNATFANIFSSPLEYYRQLQPPDESLPSGTVLFELLAASCIPTWNNWPQKGSHAIGNAVGNEIDPCSYCEELKLHCETPGGKRLQFGFDFRVTQ